ncbi:hypothetical protein NCO_03575 [Burkholderia pseudomallei]
MLGVRCSVLGTRYSVLGTRYSVLGARCSVLGARCSAFDAQRSTLNAQRSTLNAQRPAPGAWRVARERPPRARAAARHAPHALRVFSEDGRRTLSLRVRRAAHSVARGRISAYGGDSRGHVSDRSADSPIDSSPQTRSRLWPGRLPSVEGAAGDGECGRAAGRSARERRHRHMDASAHRHIGATKTPAARRRSKGPRAPRDIASTAGFFYGV